MRRPVNAPYRITTKFGNVAGYPINNGFHTGIDYVSDDKKIVAPEQIRITAINYDTRNGNYIVGYGKTGRHFFGHIKHGSISAKVGSTYKEGTKLAIMGSTGYSTGVHLHHGLRVNNKLVDPELYTKKGGDMYKGRSAKQWYEKLIKEQRNAKKVTRIAETRGKQLNDVRKKLQAALSKPPKEVVKVVEKVVYKTKDEAEVVKGWFSRLIDKLIFWNKEK